MAQEEAHIECPVCGRKMTQSERDMKLDGKAVCSHCGEEFSVRRSPDEAPARDVKRGEVFLSCCPICEEGIVFAAESEGDDRVYRCDSCDSVLKETIFGFGYECLDPRFESRKSEYNNKYLTRPEIVGAAEKIEKSRKPHKTSKKPIPVTDEDSFSESTEYSANAAEELWWQLDREELKRRKAVSARRKRDLTVDDLMEEIKKREGGR